MPSSASGPTLPSWNHGGPGRARRAVERARRVRPADGAVGDRRPQRAERRVELDERRREQQQAALGGEAIERLGLRPPLAHRLLAEHVLAGLERQAHVLGMQRGRGDHDDHVDGRIADDIRDALPRGACPGGGPRARCAAPPNARTPARAPQGPARRADRAVRGRRRARCRHPENRRQGAQFSRCGALAMIMK